MHTVSLQLRKHFLRRLENQTITIRAEARQPAILVSVTLVTVDLANIS